MKSNFSNNFNKIIKFFLINAISILLIWFIKLANIKIQKIKIKKEESQLLKINHVLITFDFGNANFLENKFNNEFIDHDLKKILEMIDFFIIKNIRYLTIFILSENFINIYSKKIINNSILLLLSFFENNSGLFSSKGIAIKFLGNKSLLDDFIVDKMNIIENNLNRNVNLVLTFLIAYDSENDLINGIKKITKKTLDDPLYLNLINVSEIHKQSDSFMLPDIDIVIMTRSNSNIADLPIIQIRQSDIIKINDLWHNCNLSFLKNTINIMNLNKSKLIY